MQWWCTIIHLIKAYLQFSIISQNIWGGGGGGGAIVTKKPDNTVMVTTSIISSVLFQWLSLSMFITFQIKLDTNPDPCNTPKTLLLFLLKVLYGFQSICKQKYKHLVRCKWYNWMYLLTFGQCHPNIINADSYFKM